MKSLSLVPWLDSRLVLKSAYRFSSRDRKSKDNDLKSVQPPKCIAKQLGHFILPSEKYTTKKAIILKMQSRIHISPLRLLQQRRRLPR